ncbi:DUF6884 domain-containing protein [Streptomyces tsukubensis]|uniref:DUF6884 domain-containing protein n=1 Tax=Streptomyces tsukubensis TaxID=83656 RepID=UPI0034505015
MPTEYLTRTRIAVDHRGDGEARLVFPAASGKGKARATAVRRLAVIYRVSATHPRRVRHWNPAASDAPLPVADELALDLSGQPERIARLLSAAPRYLARVQALATKAARAYGRWTRSAAGQSAHEYVDASGSRAYAREFRAGAFRAAADYYGISALPPRDLDPARPLWDQAARIVWDIVKAEKPVRLAGLHDEDEAAELLAAADRTPAPAATAYEEELAGLHTAAADRGARLFAALDGEELPAAGAAVPAAVEDQDHDEDQGDEELPAVPLSRVQLRWLHTAAAHPDGRFPDACNLRTLRALASAGCVKWAPGYGASGTVEDFLAYLKPSPGMVRISAAGRRRAEREERELVVIVPCGGRKAVNGEGHPRAGQPVVCAPAGELYVGSYHRATRRAADTLTRGGRTGRVILLSAKYGLVELTTWLSTYDLRAGDPGTVTGETLRRQAHELGISGASVTVLAGKAYTELAREVWGKSLDTPLGGTRGIGEQLARLADLYDPSRRPAEQHAEELRANQTEQLPGLSVVPKGLAGSPCAGAVSSGPHRRSPSVLHCAVPNRPGRFPFRRRTAPAGAFPELPARRTAPGTAIRRFSAENRLARAGRRKADARHLECCAGRLRRSALRTSGVPGKAREAYGRTDAFHAFICTCRLHRPPGVGSGLGEESR